MPGSTRAAATPARFWIHGFGELAGWAEIDLAVLECVPGRGISWRRGRRGGPGCAYLADAANINQRRASRVRLTGPVRYSDDPRLLETSLHNVERLQAERDILITKAVSWLLRNLTLRHRSAVIAYLAQNRAALPAIAVREVNAKLETGRKTPAKRSD